MLRNTPRQEEESKRVALGGDHRQQSCDRAESRRSTAASERAAERNFKDGGVGVIRMRQSNDDREEGTSSSERTAANTVRSV